MAIIKTSHTTSLGIFPEFDEIKKIEIDSTPFAEGGFGKIYYCTKINGKKPKVAQVIKVFKDNGQGCAAHSLKTTKGLLAKLRHTKNDMESFQLDFFTEYPALIGMPQFVFEGKLNGEEVAGFSSSNLIKLGYVPFSNVLDTELINKYFKLKFELLLSKAYHLSRAFRLFRSYHFIHADLKTENFFVDMENGSIALIDFDSGAIIQDIDDETYTWGTPQDMLAPEIFAQMSNNNNSISVNLNTDKWSVAIAIHYLLMGYHPLFFLTDLSKNTMNQYLTEFKWPEIDKTKPYFSSDNIDIYDDYIEDIKELPSEIFQNLSYTINQGFGSPNDRCTYEQWIFSLMNHIPDNEKRRSFSKIKIRASQAIIDSKKKKVVKKNPKSNPADSKKELTEFINSFLPQLLDNELLLTSKKSKLNILAEKAEVTGLYNKLDRLLQTYQNAIEDGVITNTELNKLKFLSRSAMADFKIINKKLNEFSRL